MRTKIFITPLVLLLTAGCSYFDAPEADAPKVDLMAQEEISSVQVADPLSSNEIATNVSSGNVQVLGLDNVYSGDVTPLSSARASSANPSVEVFSLDGGYAPAPIAAASVNAAPSAPLTPVTSAAPVAAVSNSGATKIYFEHGSANLSAQDKAVLNNVSQIIGGRPVKVVGYASTEAQVSDPKTRQAVNLRESLNRAYAAAKELIVQGVPSEQIETVGMGENAPASSADDARRVEIQPQ